MSDPSVGGAGDVGPGSVARGVDYGRRALDWFQGIAPALHRLATVLKVIAVIGMGVPVLIVVILLAESWPPSLVSIIVLIVVYGLLAAAPFGLLIFTGSVEALADLPGIIADSPDLYRRHASEINRLYRDVGDPATGKARGAGRGALGGLKLVWRMRKELPDVGGIVALARVSLFLVALAGVIMAFVNILLVPVALTGSLIHS